MDAERWQRISLLLDGALERPAAERAAWLEAECGGDRELLDEALSLLAAHEGAGSFLSATSLASESIVEDALAGRRVGNYRLIREIGRGGMSVVYLGERADRAFEQKVAVKLVRPGFVDARLAERLVAERQILARLEHPAIARLLDGGTLPDGAPYFVLEWVQGLPIDEHCDRERLTIPERIRLFCAVCDAVSYAHRNLVVHRDLKPSNILIAADGTPRLLDFGIAKVLAPVEERAAAEARTQMPGLTPRYASPEQLRHESVSTATDVYSLGLILDLLLSGALPGPAFKRMSGTADSETTVSSARLRRGPAATEPKEDEALSLDECARRRRTTPRALVQKLRGDLDNIIRQALRPEPDRRYASVERLADDLRRHLEHQPVSARPDTLRYRAGKLLQRNPLAAGLAVAIAVLVVGYGVTATLQTRRVERERQKATRALDLLVGIFRGADPYNRPSTPPTIAQVLDSGAKSTLAELGGEPELEATLSAALGDVYMNVSLPDRAEPLVERALARRRELFGSESSEVGMSLTQLGRLRFAQGNFADAEATLHESARILRERGDDGEPLADALEGLGRARFQLSHFEEAIAAHREAIAIRLARFGPDHPQLVANLVALSAVTERQGRFEHSHRLLVLALALARRHFEPDHPRVCGLYHSLGITAQDLGRLAESERFLDSSLACRKSRFGAEHGEVAYSLDSIATLLVWQGRYAEAEARFHETLAMREKILGKEHPLTALTLSNLGEVHRRLGRIALAEAELRRSLVMIEDRFGRDSLNVTRPLVSLEKLELDRGRPAAALPLIERSLAIRRKLFEPTYWRVAEVENDLGEALLALGRRAEGEKLLRDSYATLEAKPGGTEWQIDLARERLARIGVAVGEASRPATPPAGGESGSRPRR